MWGRKVDNFKFSSLNLEVNVSELSGSRQLDMNGGVEVEIITGRTKKSLKSLGIRCDASYRGRIATLDPSYKGIFQRQAQRINKLNELLDMIQNQGTAEEKAKLPAMLASIEAACLKAVSWLKDDSAYQFIGFGKRMNVETYDLAASAAAAQPSVAFKI